SEDKPLPTVVSGSRSGMCSIAIVDPFIEAMGEALKEVVTDIASLRRDNIMESLDNLEQRIPDDEDAKLALTEFLPHMEKYGHVLLDFYEETGLSPEEFKPFGDQLVEMFKREPESMVFEEQRVTLEGFGRKLKAYLLEMALNISSKTHEKVRTDSTAFMRKVGVERLEDMKQPLLIKTRALSHLLLIVHQIGEDEGETDEQFQEKCADDLESVVSDTMFRINRSCCRLIQAMLPNA
ncbi:hypothetical protein PENTCL1PPCAC_13930, partial [Pristionchus entomophagus]